MSVLESLVYFCDVVCSKPYAEHLVIGVFVGLLFGFARPTLAFWAAFFVGTGKETIDYFKHSSASVDFNYLTDPKYGLYDGMEDLLFWMLGGYLTYRLLKLGHDKLSAKMKHTNRQRIMDAKSLAHLRTLSAQPILRPNVKDPAQRKVTVEHDQLTH